MDFNSCDAPAGREQGRRQKKLTAVVTVDVPFLNTELHAMHASHCNFRAPLPAPLRVCAEDSVRQGTQDDAGAARDAADNAADSASAVAQKASNSASSAANTAGNKVIFGHSRGFVVAFQCLVEATQSSSRYSHAFL